MRKEFLAAIRANPEADAPRLLFADWLEENGDPNRAEFIRLQIERAQCESRQEVFPSSDREKELLQRHFWLWHRELQLCHMQYGYRRGFIEWMRISAQKHWGFVPVYEQCTLLCRLELQKMARYGHALTSVPWPQRLRELSLRGTVKQEVWNYLLAPEKLANITKLELLGTAEASYAIEALEQLQSHNSQVKVLVLSVEYYRSKLLLKQLELGIFPNLQRLLLWPNYRSQFLEAPSSMQKFIKNLETRFPQVSNDVGGDGISGPNPRTDHNMRMETQHSMQLPAIRMTWQATSTTPTTNDAANENPVHNPFRQWEQHWPKLTLWWNAFRSQLRRLFCV